MSGAHLKTNAMGNASSGAFSSGTSGRVLVSSVAKRQPAENPKPRRGKGNYSVNSTLPPTNMAPEGRYLEDEFPFEGTPSQLPC